MDFSKNFIKNLFKKYKIKPLKYLGQNFLIDNSVLKKIIKAAELSKNDVVLEIGPGLGNLTLEMAKKTKRVVAVEKDPRLVRILNDELKIMNIKNVEVIQGDILKISNSQYPISNKMPNVKYQNSGIGHSKIKHFIGNWKLEIGNYKVIANLPYYITASTIRKFLELENPPKMMVLMVQKEVGQRICSSKKMNLLAVSVQFYAKPEIISFISKNSFWPKPKVNSAIIKIIPHKSVLIRINPRLFFKVVKAGFSHPRKKVLRNLEKELKLNRKKVEGIFLRNKIDFNSRPENLSLKDWLLLVQDLCYNNLGKYENYKIF